MDIIQFLFTFPSHICEVGTYKNINVVQAHLLKHFLFEILELSALQIDTDVMKQAR